MYTAAGYSTSPDSASAVGAAEERFVVAAPGLANTVALDCQSIADAGPHR